jgi:predicted MFS family arabinose efflux permease
MSHPNAASAPAVSASQNRSALQILIIAVAAFVIVTTEYLIVGLLPALARDFDISVAAAGQLVTLFAFTVMLFGPFLTAKLSHLDRKKLFTFILVVFAASNVLAALAPNIWVLALARFIPALMLPVFWGTASETAGQLAPPGQAGKAVSQIYLGISAALVFGIPLGTLAADAIGWRGTFWILAGLSALLAVLIQTLTPQLPPPERHHSAGQTQILKSPRFLAHVALSTLAFTAMFTAYTYLADMLESLAGIPANQVGWWLMGFGVFGMAGNYIGGRVVDRSPLGSTIVFLLLMAVALLAAVPAATHPVWLVAVLIVWGVSYTALFPVCQVRVMQAGTQAKALAGTMNVSAANAGTGLGAILGGLGIQHYGLESLGVMAAAIAVAAMVLAAVRS